MSRTTFLAVPLLTLALAAGACSGQEDPSAKEFKDQLSDELAVSKDLSTDVADCYADVIVDELGIDRLNDVEISDDAPPSDEQTDFIEAVQKATSECS